MIRSRISTHCARFQQTSVERLGYYLWLCPLVISLSACGPKQLKVPEDVETIAHRCYLALATPGRTPQLEPAKEMENGTFLILWSMAEAKDEQGSCNVDGRGALLLVTNNADVKTPSEEKTTGEATPQE